MSADLLRRAAVKLREHAEKASRAPWVAHDDGLVWPDRLGDPVSGSEQLDDAKYIAMLHPPVALALAHWLEVVAVWPDSHLRADHPSVALAREILREPQL